jgi:hypothetical protein
MTGLASMPRLSSKCGPLNRTSGERDATEPFAANATIFGNAGEAEL